MGHLKYSFVFHLFQYNHC